MFSKNDYMEIARIFRHNITGHFSVEHLFRGILLDFVELFKENPRFDEKKFKDAIYGKEE